MVMMLFRVVIIRAMRLCISKKTVLVIVSRPKTAALLRIQW
jgi:hypothetical protein